MDYKEKYNEALERAKKELDVCGSQDCDAVRQIFRLFPELKESEDERIRKELIRLVYVSYNNLFPYTPTKEEYEEMTAWLEKQVPIDRDKVVKGVRQGVATSLMNYIDANTKGMCLSNMECVDIENAIVSEDWDKVYRYMKKKLEKQGEQEPANKVKPKFKAGDWIVWQDKCYKVNYNGCGYELVDQNGLSTTLEYGTIDENAHLWNIKDAKDGDVLLFEGYYNSIVLFQGIGINGKGRINYHCKCDLGKYSFGIQDDVACLGTIEKDAENYHPATKEQRDLLFQKMKEAGYDWDAKKKRFV